MRRKASCWAALAAIAAVAAAAPAAAQPPTSFPPGFEEHGPPQEEPPGFQMGNCGLGPFNALEANQSSEGPGASEIATFSPQEAGCTGQP
jgi:hypothetical protein